MQTIVDNMPGGIGAGVYTQAAKALYRMGVNEVGSFAEALKLTGPEGSMGGAVRQMLALGKQGENALKLAYLQGKGEAEVYNAHKAGELGSGKGAVRPDAGTVYRGDKAVSGDKSADEAFLKLTAQSTGTAIHRMMQGLENNAKGCIKAAAGEMFFAGDAGSETVMHETFHALNQWSAETGQAVMDRLLNYLVQQSGAESTEKLRPELPRQVRRGRAAADLQPGSRGRIHRRRHGDGIRHGGEFPALCAPAGGRGTDERRRPGHHREGDGQDPEPAGECACRRGALLSKKRPPTPPPRLRRA